MKNILNKLIIFISVIVLFAGIVFVGDRLIKNNNNDNDNKITFVTGTDNKIWYIESKDCLKEVYENTDNKGIFDSMCRSYTTDGEFVYYDGGGMINMTPPQIIAPQFNLDGSFSSSTTMSPPREKGPIVIEGVDLETFEIITVDYLDDSLDPKKNPTLIYSRDKNYLYRQGKRVEGIDPNTLIILGRGYLRDKDSMYYRDKKIEGSDPNSFEFLEGGYARDNNFVYLYIRGQTIEGSDGATFEILDRNYAKDSLNVYYKREKIDSADSKTFELIFNELSGYARDKNTIYYRGEKLEGTDPHTFTMVYGSSSYVKDDNFVYSYYLAKKIPSIHAKTFEHIFGNYFKDRDHVYFRGEEVIANADPETFEVLDGIYLKDKNYVWKSSYDEGGSIKDVSIIWGADQVTFEFLGETYARDKNFVYMGGTFLLGVDTVSIEVLNYRYIKDKNYVYLSGKKLQGVDSSTFEVIDYSYTKDKNFVYYKEMILMGVNPEFFELLKCGFVKDNSNIFFVDQKGILDRIDVAEVASFEMIDNTCYAKDKNSVYFADNAYRTGGSYKRIEGADSKTFEIIERAYTKDISNVYYRGVIIKDADSKSFEIIGARGMHAKDNNFVYYKKFKIVGADAKSFEIIGGSYWKDLSSVYYDGFRIEGADVETFEISGFQTVARDKNTLYREGKSITENNSTESGANSPRDFIVPLPWIEDVQVIQIYPVGI